MKAYTLLLFFHSIFRWLLLASLLFALVRGIRGWMGHRIFTSTDNQARHITATIAHIQLTIGYGLYFVSPLVQWFRSHTREGMRQVPIAFFGLIHIACMTIAIILLTIGSSAARRRVADRDKFKTMSLWFATALLVILIAIPWPFSPLAQRPLFRTFFI